MYKEVANIIKNSKNLIAFTGAGISVESGIPTFRGKNGIWSKYDPKILDLDYFLKYPKESWEKIKEIFYDYMKDKKPNYAHYFLSELEQKNILKAVITQNIDNLHQEAGSKNVIEFHGTAKKGLCLKCFTKHPIEKIDLNTLPPLCPKCNGLLKPDFVFFKEAIPEDALIKSFELAKKVDVILVIGTTGEIIPASQIPIIAKQNKAIVIEINPEESAYTHTITDIHLKEKASIATKKIKEYINF